MAHVMVNCATCGRDFETTKYKAQRNDRHFCCRACFNGFGRTQATCPQCRRSFVRRSSRVKAYLKNFCSAECQTLYRQSHNIRIQYQCEYCGITFERRSEPRENQPHKFCSHKCHSRAIDIRFEKECPVCHKTFVARPSTIKRGGDTYCSWGCKIKGKERTTLEKSLAHILDTLQIEYIEQHPIGRYACDFYLPKHLAVIEADGFYHHKLPKVKVSDARKNAYLLTRGYKVLRLQGDDRNRLPLSAENQILEFVKMPGTHVQLPLIG